MGSNAFGGLIVCWLLGACTTEPAHSLYGISKAEPPRCAHSVRLLRGAEGYEAPARALASLSTTCSAIAPLDCENALLARACQLDADAVWVKDEGFRGAGVSASKAGRMTLAGVALSFQTGAGTASN